MRLLERGSSAMTNERMRRESVIVRASGQSSRALRCVSVRARREPLPLHREDRGIAVVRVVTSAVR